jgi:hypothetical protein
VLMQLECGPFRVRDCTTSSTPVKQCLVVCATTLCILHPHFKSLVNAAFAERDSTSEVLPLLTSHRSCISTWFQKFPALRQSIHVTFL